MLFTFPSRYWFTIGHQRVFCLGRWASRIQTGFHVSRPTWDPARVWLDFAYGPFTLWGRTFQNFPLSSQIPRRGPATPSRKRDGLGMVPFRSPLLRESRLISFPPGTEMFHFPGFRLEHPMYSGADSPVLPGLGFPIRTPPDQCVFAAPRRFSQLATSFIAC